MPSNGPTDVVCDTTQGRFGPFADQLFIGDMMKGTIVRVALEKIHGEYQGACILFRRGVGAVSRMVFGPDQRLYLTRVSRGWGGAGRGEGLARLEFSGKTPLEIESVGLLTDGFELRFTLPIAKSVSFDIRDYRIEQYRYEYWEKYGSPKIDRELLTIRSADFSADRKSLKLRADKIKTGRVCHIMMPRLQAVRGETLLHADAFYTVNHLKN